MCLSDLIGFAYSGWGADAAADDFVRRLAEGGRRYVERGGRGEPVIPIILDGENAWEHFDGGGRPFLRALYHRLSSHPELRTVTMAEACAEPSEELTGIFPGSWIDANFSIWIGHADDQRAWSQLADARDALDFGGAAEGAAAAREEVLIAEGSDWFWWYGDDHSSAHDAEFDDLFRRHLRNVYRLLNRPVPDELYMPNRSTDRAVSAQDRPDRTDLAHHRRRAHQLLRVARRGLVRVPRRRRSDAPSERQPPVVRCIGFGFDREPTLHPG
jgi:alpha-amylase/alpha-mannosidase (GH57 family)